LAVAALCAGTTPESVADEIGEAGSGALKQCTADAVNSFLASHRARRAELAAEPAVIDRVLRAGNVRANELARETLDEVRTAMGMAYANI
jgi:tryptophanyl-tRNA synthetase